MEKNDFVLLFYSLEMHRRIQAFLATYTIPRISTKSKEASTKEHGTLDMSV
jgi:hypothetical protein